ncbi:alpha/beta fold hydrolase [Acuticoccus sp.]|uniref:alpha/beta fold hydrolase n=1 Tax=Acuticoccus sp. TaxID=1904378 RepID=UPI003B52EB7F
MATATSRSPDSGGTVGTLHSAVRLRVARWPGTPDGPGTVVLVQGRGEAIEAYAEVIADLRRRGFAVLTYDHRGQGGSQRRVAGGGHVASYGQYVDDLLDVVRHGVQEGLPRPYYVLAHSMGGLVALLAQPQLAEEVERMVLVAPLLGIHRLPAPPAIVALVVGLARLLGLGRTKVARSVGAMPSFADNRITSDPRRYRAYKSVFDDHPQLTTGAPTLAWVGATLSAMARVRRRTGTPLAIPTLFVAAGSETIVSTPAIDRFARAAPGGGVVIVPGARHHLLIERDGLRVQAFAAIDAFIRNVDRRLAVQRPVRFARTMRFEEGPPLHGTGMTGPDGAVDAEVAEPRDAVPTPTSTVATAPPGAPEPTVQASDASPPPGEQSEAKVPDVADGPAGSARLRERLRRRRSRRGEAAADGQDGSVAGAPDASEAEPSTDDHDGSSIPPEADATVPTARPADPPSPRGGSSEGAEPSGGDDPGAGGNPPRRRRAMAQRSAEPVRTAPLDEPTAASQLRREGRRRRPGRGSPRKD